MNTSRVRWNRLGTAFSVPKSDTYTSTAAVTFLSSLLSLRVGTTGEAGERLLGRRAHRDRVGLAASDVDELQDGLQLRFREGAGRAESVTPVLPV
jgi:hypothetical protein